MQGQNLRKSLMLVSIKGWDSANNGNYFLPFFLANCFNNYIILPVDTNVIWHMLIQPTCSGDETPDLYPLWFKHHHGHYLITGNFFWCKETWIGCRTTAVLWRWGETVQSFMFTINLRQSQSTHSIVTASIVSEYLMWEGRTPYIR